MQPVAQQPGLTNFTFTQQIDVGGVVPPWIVNRLITQDAVTFVKRVGVAAAGCNEGRRARHFVWRRKRQGGLDA